MKILCVLLVTLVAAQAFSDSPPAGGAVAALNQELLSRYRADRDRFLNYAPVIIDLGQSRTVVLIHQGVRREAKNANRPTYEFLKGIAHIPIGVTLLLKKIVHDPASYAAQADALKSVATLLPGAEQDVEAFALSASQKTRQLRMLKSTQTLLAKVQNEQKLSEPELARFLAALRDDIQKNMDDAVQARLEGLHAIMQEWEKQLGPEWSKVKAIVLGPHMARQENVSMTYFEWLLGEKKEGDRVIYAEGLIEGQAPPKEEQARALLATHLADRELSIAFFGDPDRLHKEVMADSIAPVLARLAPIR
jgi:hypothetical protein